MPYRADTLIMRTCRHCFRLSKHRHPGGENNGGGTCHEKRSFAVCAKNCYFPWENIFFKQHKK